MCFNYVFENIDVYLYLRVIIGTVNSNQVRCLLFLGADKSIFGLILFIIYINDIPQSVDSVCQLFADDTKLYRVISGAQDQEALQCDINNFCTWSDKW